MGDARVLARALLAVDRDGLWIAQSYAGGFPLHATAAQVVAYEGLYRVAPGATTPSRTFTVGLGGASWLAASGHTVWLEANRGRAAGVLWRLRGPHATPTLRGLYRAGSDQGAEYGSGPPTYAGNGVLGIYYVADDFAGWTATSQRVVRLSSNSAAERRATTVKLPRGAATGGESPPAVVLGGSLFFLDPPVISYPGGSAAPAVEGTGVVYRVTPRG